MGEDFFASNFWVYWLSMFAIGPWHGALEMKLYMNRFVQHFGGFADLSTVKSLASTSTTLWSSRWSTGSSSKASRSSTTRGSPTSCSTSPRSARSLAGSNGCKAESAEDVDVTENDLVLITNGSPVENTAWGDHHTPAKWIRDIREGSIWALWRNIAAQDPAFGRPDKFCTHTDKSSYESACISTLDDKIPPYIERICQRDPFKFDSSPITGGLVTVRDSNWLLSWNVERNPHFRDAAEGPADDPRLRHVQPRPARQLRQEGDE